MNSKPRMELADDELPLGQDDSEAESDCRPPGDWVSLYACPTLLALAGAAAFFFRISAKGIWVDEAFTLSLIKLPWVEFRQILAAHEANQALYYVLLKLWCDGDSLAWARALSALFGVGAVVAVYFLGRALFSTFAGVAAGLLLLSNAQAIAKFQEARGYGMLLCLAAAGTLLFVQCLKQPHRNWRWFLYGLFCVASVYTHFFGALVIIAHLVSLTVLPRRKIPFRSLLVVYGGAFIALIPLALFILFRSGSQTDWAQTPGTTQIFRTFFVLAGGSRDCLRILLAVVLVGVITAIWKVVRTGRGYPAWSWALPVVWFFLPLVLVLLVSLLKPMFCTRYFTILLPALAVLAGGCLNLVRHRWLRYVPLLLLAHVAQKPAAKFSYCGQKEDWRQPVRHLEVAAKSSDAIVVFCPFTRLCVDYHAARMSPDRKLQHIPYFAPVSQVHPLYLVPAGYTMGGAQPPADPRLAERLTATGADRVWLVLAHEKIEHLGRTRRAEAIRRLIESAYDEIGVHEYERVTLVQYRRTPGRQ